MKTLLRKLNQISRLDHPHHLMKLTKPEWEKVRFAVWLSEKIPDLVAPEAYDTLLNDFRAENQAAKPAEKV